MEDAAGALERALGAKPPKLLLEALSEQQVADLAATLDEARRAQAKELAVAGEKAIGQIPRLLRLPVRKLVGL